MSLVKITNVLESVDELGFIDKNRSSAQSATDYWVGGINPGLIWIWSESGSKVKMDRQFWNDNDNSSNAPGCLKLSYSMRLGAFFFKGVSILDNQFVTLSKDKL